MSLTDSAVYYGFYSKAAPTEDNPDKQIICGAEDEGAEPGVFFLASLPYMVDGSTGRVVLTTDIVANSTLGKAQRMILRKLKLHGDYYNKCSWWQAEHHNRRVKILESLRKYGYVGFKRRYPSKIFTLTPAGNMFYEQYLGR